MQTSKVRSNAATFVIVISVVVLPCLAACGGETSSQRVGLGGAGVAAAVAGSGPASSSATNDKTNTTLAGRAAATNPPNTGAPSGTPGSGAAGASPSAGSAGERSPASVGTPATVNAGSPATTAPAGRGGTGAAGVSGSPGTSASSEDAIIRGDEPTDATGTSNGPFEVSMYTKGFAKEAGFLAATIYYPADAEAPFSYVVFCPGFVSYQTSIQDWGPFLASHGIVIMTIDTNSSSDSVTVRQTALKDALSSLQKENERSDSPLAGKLHKTRFGLMGWSMGGGASLLNAVMHPEYKSIVTVAEHLATSPGTSAPLKSLSVPTLMFAGTADTTVLGLNMSQPAYEAIPETTSKMLYEVQGADHFFFNTPSALKGVVGKYGLAWQKVFLEGDDRYKKLLSAEGPMASDFRTNVQ